MQHMRMRTAAAKLHINVPLSNEFIFLPLPKMPYLQSFEDEQERETKHIKIWNMSFLRFELLSILFFFCENTFSHTAISQKPFTSISAIFANNKCQNYSNLKFNFSCISSPSSSAPPLVSHPLCLFCIWIFYDLNFFIGCCELLSKKLKLYKVN